MAKVKRARKAKVAPEQQPLEGMADARNLDLDAAISDHLKAKQKAVKATEEAQTAQDRVGEIMKAEGIKRYSYENYDATVEDGKPKVKIKRSPKKSTAK